MLLFAVRWFIRIIYLRKEGISCSKYKKQLFKPYHFTRQDRNKNSQIIYFRKHLKFSLIWRKNNPLNIILVTKIRFYANFLPFFLLSFIFCFLLLIFHFLFCLIKCAPPYRGLEGARDPGPPSYGTVNSPFECFLVCGYIFQILKARFKKNFLNKPEETVTNSRFGSENILFHNERNSANC